MRRRRVLAAAVVVLLVLGAVFLLLRDDDSTPPPRGGIDPPAARARAVSACAAVDELFALVIANGPASEVLDAAERAKVESSAARELDPLWSGLASGADALQTGLQKDNARTTRLGRQVLDTQCGFLRAPEPVNTPSAAP